MSEKNQVTTQVRMDVEVSTLLLRNDKNCVIAENVLSYFLCLFFDKTYLQKPHCVMIENTSSNEM